MRIEEVNGNYLLCGCVIDKHLIRIGQIWAAADGSGAAVEVIAIRGDWIVYAWHKNGERKMHVKDWFSFQSRYCLVVNKNENLERFK